MTTEKATCAQNAKIITTTIEPPIEFNFRIFKKHPFIFVFNNRNDLYAALGIPNNIGDSYDLDSLRASVHRAMKHSPYQPCAYRGDIYPSLYALASHLHCDPSKLYWLCSEGLLDCYE